MIDKIYHRQGYSRCPDAWMNIPRTVCKGTSQRRIGVSTCLCAQTRRLEVVPRADLFRLFLVRAAGGITPGRGKTSKCRAVPNFHVEITIGFGIVLLYVFLTTNF